MKSSALRSPFVVSLVLGLSLCGFLALAAGGGQQRQSKPRATAAKAKPTPRARATRATPPSPTPSPAAAAQRLPRRLPEAYDSPREAAEFFRFKRLPAGATELPVEKYLEAQEQMRLMPRYSTAEERLLPARAALPESERAALPAWTPLGPNNIGGRTRALLIHPANPSVMYAASVAGGVWKTVNGGALWSPPTDLLANLTVNTLTMDPKNPDVIYAGTGEGYFNIDGIRGAGIFKTTDPSKLNTVLFSDPLAAFQSKWVRLF